MTHFNSQYYENACSFYAINIRQFETGKCSVRQTHMTKFVCYSVFVSNI